MKDKKGVDGREGARRQLTVVWMGWFRQDETWDGLAKCTIIWAQQELSLACCTRRGETRHLNCEASPNTAGHGWLVSDSFSFCLQFSSHRPEQSRTGAIGTQGPKWRARAPLYQARPNEPRAQKGRCGCREAFNVPGLLHSLSLWAPSAACLSWSQIKTHSQDVCVCSCVCAHMYLYSHTEWRMCTPVTAFLFEDYCVIEIIA